MLASDNTEVDRAAILDLTDITIEGLLGFLAGHKEMPLVFFYGGRAVQPGYHVTEVKAGQFAALDCGANAESWSEIFVQLWDVNEDSTYMPAAKFSAIIRKVTEHVGLDHAAKLTFEVSDGVRPMQLYRAALPEIVAGAVHVELSPRPASCKPRDRWLEEQNKVDVSCCGPASGGKPCCG
ncbi:MAG: hypothetical protein E5V49_15490 [Mesorhizobium sp.]|nr:hypothetical protein EN848_01540 [bacterium M00.F.Ca.ET.205.01.1.1]TGU55030.1 hypothetical protein EN795_05955 [bacterium M00.F.Ca.ET.152.01.1.1]TGV38998.1 hypothetical protein EN829_007125 [Mesorhizobium sp. M00.F.Ca.ET.186.01.1.1]TGZ44605.1 hypothetical protein EN805_05960 [bacterium M00.F.Ca.ET.162.01.1.1]TIW60614.1 MAG: hypothetical protein E5V48_12895 [Mesorhizobium sp.]